MYTCPLPNVLNIKLLTGSINILVPFEEKRETDDDEHDTHHVHVHCKCRHFESFYATVINNWNTHYTY